MVLADVNSQIKEYMEMGYTKDEATHLVKIDLAEKRRILKENRVANNKRANDRREKFVKCNDYNIPKRKGR